MRIELEWDDTKYLLSTFRGTKVKNNHVLYGVHMISRISQSYLGKYVENFDPQTALNQACAQLDEHVAYRAKSAYNEYGSPKSDSIDLDLSDILKGL